MSCGLPSSLPKDEGGTGEGKEAHFFMEKIAIQPFIAHLHRAVHSSLAGLGSGQCLDRSSGKPFYASLSFIMEERQKMTGGWNRIGQGVISMSWVRASFSFIDQNK